MKIITLQAENIKKLIAVEIKPDGNLVQITGKNGNGKTSVLDSIWWALAGASGIQGKPIRDGEKKARIRLDLGEIVVTRTFKAAKDGDYTTAISVENAEGGKFPSPQSMLDDLLGQLSFDPLAFSRSDAKAQFNTLRRFVPGVDFDAIDMQNKADYAKRTEANKKAKESQALADNIGVLKEEPELVDESQLMDQFEKAGKQNADIAVRKANRQRIASDIATRKDEMDRLIQESDKIAKRLAILNDEAEKMAARISTAPPLPAAIDVSEIRKKIDTAKEAIAYHAAQKKRGEHISESEKAEAEAEALTSSMEKREAEKKTKVAAAKLPVAGISFGDGVVLLNEVPFEQASDAEQLRASIAIAMALNPKLRVIRVRDGSLLDENSMKILSEMADTNDVQVWIERVDGSGKVGFVLEDGHLKKQEEQEEDF